MRGLKKGRVVAAVLALPAAVFAAGHLERAEAAAPDTPRRVEIQATSAGFVPDTVRLVADASADLVFTRTAGAGCVAQVHIPDLGVGITALPEGQPVAIRIQPEEPGAYEFRCGMNMRKGVIIVAPRPGR